METDCEKQENSTYNDYHIDIWFLISEHIEPEDVGRFALICRKTEAVVSSMTFWLNLYKKYCKKNYHIIKENGNKEFVTKRYVHPLPGEILKNKLLVGHLRTKVIWLLCYSYPPFIIRAEPNFNKITRLLCRDIWIKEKFNSLIFCYRFTNGVKMRKSPGEILKYFQDKNNYASEIHDDEDLNAVLHDFYLQRSFVFNSPFEGQHLLVIFTKRFVPLPNFNGEAAFLSLVQPDSENLKDCNLELNFSNYKNEFITKIVYSTVHRINVISWWNPEFISYCNVLK